MYAKLRSGYLIPAAENLPTKEDYIAAGYKPVEFIPQPENSGSNGYAVGWEETSDAIVQVWALTPLPDDIDEAEAYNIIFGGAE